MKKNKAIVISLIIAIIIIATIFIIKSNNTQSHKNSNKPTENSDINISDDIQEHKNTNNQSNIALESNNNSINTERTDDEQIEDKGSYNIIYPDGRLFITFDNKVYLPSTAVQEFNFDFPRTPTNNYLKLIREYFNKLWDTLECDIITIKENDYDATAKLQFSRYEVPTNDLTFYLSSTINFYEGGTYIIDNALLYTEYFSNYINVRIADGNIGRSIHAFKINNTWYAYKLNVIE